MAGLWTAKEALASTNVRELLVLLRALRIWGSRWRGRRVRWRTDSAVAYRYLKKVHGRFRHLTMLARKIHFALRRFKVDMTFELVPGSQIPVEDNLSRLSDRHDYKLSDKAFARIRANLVTPRCDLFASRFSTRAKKFFSRRPDPLASGVDAFAQSWEPSRVGLSLAFPPPLLARRVIQKAAWEKALLILVLPRHLVSSWLPLLRQCTVLHHRELLLPPGSVEVSDPILASWNWTAMRIQFA